MNARHRKNLLKLAAYLESLPRDYKHFDMWTYVDHNGECELPMPEPLYAARKPKEFLSNCGTVACAVGHGPATGIRLLPDEIDDDPCEPMVYWSLYAERVFVREEDWPDAGPFEFLFGSTWKSIDNHHYGAAARIRYFLDTGRYDHYVTRGLLRKYAAYLKGSRSAKRREIDAVSA